MNQYVCDFYSVIKPSSSPQLRKKGPPSAADKEEAERLKTEGNNLMRTEKFTEALDMYSKVIMTIFTC